MDARRILLPSTRLGIWSAGLLGGFFVLFGLFQLFVALGVRSGDTYWSQPVLSIPITLAAVSAFSGGVVAVVAGIKDRDITVLSVLSFLVAVFVTIFVLGEVITPH